MTTRPSADPITVLTGAYTPDTGGDGAGLTVLRFDPAAGSLAADPELPPVPVSGASYLAAHPSLDVVYCTGEAESGAVSAVALGVAMLIWWIIICLLCSSIIALFIF
jgi:hypothetical protein